jgi:DNA-binding XRE family transcriptional regulator
MTNRTHELRLAAGLSKRELALQAGVSRETITHAEQGRDLLERTKRGIALAFGLPVAQVFPEAAEPEAERLTDAALAAMLRRFDAETLARFIVAAQQVSRRPDLHPDQALFAAALAGVAVQLASGTDPLTSIDQLFAAVPRCYAEEAA